MKRNNYPNHVYVKDYIRITAKDFFFWKHYSHCRTATISVAACLPALTDLAVYNRTAVPGSVPSHSYVNEAAAIRCPIVWHGSFWDTELLMFHDLDSAASSLCFNHFHATQKMSCLSAVILLHFLFQIRDFPLATSASPALSQKP